MSPPYGYPAASYAPQAAGVAMQPSPQGLPPPAKPGTLPVGTRIMIGQYKVNIERFLSEGMCPRPGLLVLPPVIP